MRMLRHPAKPILRLIWTLNERLMRMLRHPAKPILLLIWTLNEDMDLEADSDARALGTAS
jgi:hypothetical protein